MLALDAGAVVADGHDAGAIFHAAFDPDGRRVPVEGFFAHRVERILEQVGQDVDELGFVGADGQVFRQFLLDVDFVLPFVAQETQRGGDDFGDLDLIQAVGVRMRKHAQIGNDVLHPADAVFHVFDNILEVGLLVRGDVFALLAQREQTGRGKIQRVVDFVDNAGAHHAQGGHFLLLHQLQLGLGQFLNGVSQLLVLRVELLIGLLQRLFVLVQFEAQREFPEAQPVKKIVAGHHNDAGQHEKIKVVEDYRQILACAFEHAGRKIHCEHAPCCQERFADTPVNYDADSKQNEIQARVIRRSWPVSFINHADDKKGRQQRNRQTKEFVMLLAEIGRVQKPKSHRQRRTEQTKHEKKPHLGAVDEEIQHDTNRHQENDEHRSDFPGIDAFLALIC